MKTKLEVGTGRDYHLTCKILVMKKSFEDFQSKGTFQNENYFVYLIPVLNGEAYAFFDAWLPLDNKEQVEVPMEMKHPFNTNARGCVRRADASVPYHHIHLMSYGLAQLIVDNKKSLHGKEIQITVLDEHSDAAADLTVKGDLPFDQKRYDSPSASLEPGDGSHLGKVVGEIESGAGRRKVFAS